MRDASNYGVAKHIHGDLSLWIVEDFEGGYKATITLDRGAKNLFTGKYSTPSEAREQFFTLKTSMQQETAQ